MTIDSLTKKDRALYVDMEIYLHSDEWQVAADTPSVLWLRWKRGWLNAVAAENPAVAREVIEQIPPDDAVIWRGCEGLRELAAEYGFTGCNPCYQVVYEKPQPVPVNTELIIRHPDERDLPKFMASYHLGAPDELRKAFFGPDFLGGYLNGEFIGYIGLHDEGSMGMLQVFPPYRRRGFAEALYGTLINNQLKKGRLPFAQVIASNQASLLLQRKLGFRISNDLLYWTWRK